MKLDLRPLLAGDRLLTFEYELLLDTDPTDTASFLYGVSFPSPMKVKGEITNTAGYMRMQLTASVNYQAECARCLRPLGGEFTLDLEKTVAPRNLLTDLDEDKLDDYGYFSYPSLWHSPKLPGMGGVDFGAFVSALNDIRYDGNAVIEVEDKAFENCADDVRAGIEQSYRFMKQYM